MKKPQKYTRAPVYVWSEIVQYIQKKHGIFLRDVNGKFRADNTEGVEYLDFWHSMIRWYDDELRGVIQLRPDDLCLEAAKSEDWEIKILQILKDEFGECFEVDTSW